MIDYDLQDFKLPPQFMIVLSYKTLSRYLGKRNAAIIFLHLPENEENQEDRKEAQRYIVCEFEINGGVLLADARKDELSILPVAKVSEHFRSGSVRGFLLVYLSVGI